MYLSVLLQERFPELLHSRLLCTWLRIREGYPQVRESVPALLGLSLETSLWQPYHCPLLDRPEPRQPTLLKLLHQTSSLKLLHQTFPLNHRLSRVTLPPIFLQPNQPTSPLPLRQPVNLTALDRPTLEIKEKVPDSEDLEVDMEVAAVDLGGQGEVDGEEADLVRQDLQVLQGLDHRGPQDRQGVKELQEVKHRQEHQACQDCQGLPVLPDRQDHQEVEATHQIQIDHLLPMERLSLQ
ncbi:hypothetical protein R3P38DRAFT_3174261 [Favolaschia claudopus]|uniref:Uncharacterized protein n=1 Tax=Favolaschia claudopus TaxID=2862362 RepID=A0AAW0D5T7_9AGAR